MKSKILFSVGTIGVLFMMAGQLSFSINDSYVKLVVKNIGDDNSLYSVIFLRGLVTSSLLGLYLIFFEKKNLIKILELDKQDIILDKIKKILTVDESGKERIFFNLFQKS